MIRLSARPARACCWVLTLFITGTAAADFNEPRGELTLPAALSAALSRNPGLRSGEFELRAAAARTIQAGQRPAPQLEASFENFGGSGEVRGGSSLETTLSLSQVIELGGKRRHRLDVAGFDRAAVAIERSAAQLDVLAEVTRRFIEVAAQQEQLLLVRQHVELAEKTATAIAGRVAAARAPEAERSRATIALGRARLDEQRARQNLLSGHRRLAALWGSTEPRFGDVRAQLFELPPVANFDGLVERLRGNPDFLRFASRARLRDAQWQLAQAEARADVTVGAGVRRFEATGDTGFVVNVSMPLPLSGRNRGAVLDAALQRERVDADADAAFIDTQAALFEFYQNLQQARAETQALREQLIPQAQAALAQTRYGYERGRFSYVELADAQRELLELQRAAVAAAASYHRTLAEIERLTDAPLAQSGDTSS